jgi:O-antigen/teichoic acid export membrane protein
MGPAASALRALRGSGPQWLRRGSGAPASRGRGAQRYRRAAFGGVAMLYSNGLKMLGALATLPLALNYLGAERFGLWVTLTSLMLLANVGDFGIGNGLINALSAAHGNDDRETARIYVSSVLFTTLLLSSVLLAALLSVEAIVPWASVFHLASPVARSEARPAVTVVTLCVILHVPLGVLVKIRTGYQEMHVNGIWQSLGVALGFGALVLSIWYGASLPWLIAADAGGNAIAMIGNLGRLFLVDRPWLRPSLRCVQPYAARALLAIGLQFFALALIGMVAFYSDNLLAIWACGPQAAGLFAICARLFSPCRLLAGTMLAPLWPAYGEAIKRGDVAWVRRTIAASIAVSVMVVLPLALGLAFFGDTLASVWMRRPVAFGAGLLFGMALWVTVETIGSAISYFLNGASLIRVQLVLGAVFTAVAVVTKVSLAMHFGIAGIAWGTLISYAGVMLPPSARIVRQQLRDLGRQRAATPLGSAVPGGVSAGK